MYENVRKPTSRRDGMLLVWICLAVILLIALAAPVAWGVHLQLQYKNFVNDLTDSVLYGKQHGSITVSQSGERSTVTSERASRLYEITLTIGAGKPQKSAPEADGLLLEFGDGSSLFFCPAFIPESGAEDTDGVYFRYTGSNGVEYAYDTPRLSYDVLYAAVFPGQSP